MDYHLQDQFNRRTFLKRTGGVGLAALVGILGNEGLAATIGKRDDKKRIGGLDGVPHFAPKAKRVIYLFQSGAPSQMELFDHKPRLAELFGTELPDSIRKNQRLTGMTATQTKFPVASSMFKFAQHGQSRAWLSELLPHMSKVVDDVCFIKSLYTEAINHDPATTFFQTGFQLAGRPSIGSWLSYGLGSENKDLPAFVVMVSQGTGNAQALADRAWGSGFLPTRHQGVKFRSGSDPVLYLSNPPGYTSDARRHFLDDLGKLNHMRSQEVQDP